MNQHNSQVMDQIWHHSVTVNQLNKRGSGTMVDFLDIVFEEIGPNFLKASMPVDHRTIQPLGLLHGGASVVLAESVGSVAGALCVDLSRQYTVGIEVNANHLRSARRGRVMAKAIPLHIGRKTQVWHIDIKDEDNRPITASRLTLAVMDFPNPDPNRLSWLMP